jgi:hypothetical protein
MKAERDDLVLAFYPHARGFSYVVFEGSLSLVDWGMSDVPAKRKTPVCLGRLSFLLDQYGPDGVVIRQVPQGRLAKLSEAITELVESRRIVIAAVSRDRIREAFGHLGSPTRYAIVQAIAKRIPVLAPYVPPVRKIWYGEDRRMGLFDAAAMALTFFESNGQRGEGVRRVWDR